MLRVVELLAQPLHLLLGLEPQRIVGLDAQHEVHAALEVEAELELLVHQPAGRGRCRSAPRRSDRRRRPQKMTKTARMVMSFQRRLDICLFLTVFGRRSRRPAPGPDSRRWPLATLRSGPCRRSAAARVCSPSLRDLSVDAAGRDDPIADLQAVEKLLHLLLLPLHRQQDDEVEDGQDERRTERAAARGCRRRASRPWRTRDPAYERHHES